MENKLRKMNLENLDKMEEKEKEQKKIIKDQKPRDTYKLNISNIELNKKAKESTIYYVLKKVKLQNELKDNYKLASQELKRPYNLKFTRDYIFLPFGEIIFISILGIFQYKNRLNLNAFGGTTCILAIANEFAKNYIYQKQFKNEYEEYAQTKRNYKKIMDSYTSKMTFGTILEHYFKLEKINVRNNKVLNIIKPERKKCYEKEAFQELMFVFESLVK